MVTYSLRQDSISPVIDKNELPEYTVTSDSTERYEHYKDSVNNYTGCLFDKFDYVVKD